MHLIKSNSAREAESQTPESVFAEKYAWLLGWAMSFTQNDRAVAEDLVQDTFVRLIVSWPRIKDNLGQLDAFLYSTLKYAHLMELRRGRRVSFMDPALIEFDDLHQSLKEEKNVDPIQVQDDLRRVVAYLCWRKRSAKSASVLLLRFFHGYFPDEIASIAIMKRGPIAELLRLAREEVKSYLADPSRIEVMRQGKPPELMPRRLAVPPEEFDAELRATIFQARTAPCPGSRQLLTSYQGVNPKPISCALLAHIVSCESCLKAVHGQFNFPSPQDRFEDGMTGSSRRARRSSGASGGPSKDEVRRSISGGLSRFRKLYEHHPRVLMIVANGEVLAMRDVNSATSELRVQTLPEKSLGIIDVISEQGISLLNLYVDAIPPEAPPEIRHGIALSDDRKLELVLRFTSEGAVIDLHYDDPLFLAAPSASSALSDESEWDDATEPFGFAFAESEVASLPPRRSWWRRLLDKMNAMALPEMTPMLATATVCAVASVVLLVLSFRAASVIKPDDLLKRASASEEAPAQAGVAGVVVQSVRIQTPQRKLERTLYRDVQGTRQPKEKVPGQQDAALRSQLEAVGVTWNNPLSVASFSYWHDHAAISRDAVKRTGDGLLTLTTTAESGAVVSESLTVRAADFHPVGRTIELRNAGTVEIAELSYSVLPWASVNPDLFESANLMPALPGSDLHPTLLPHLPALPSTAQIDEAELEVRLVLNRLHMDTTGRIELNRAADGVHVQGIVDTDDQKNQLQSQLRLVPHVQPLILTAREMAAKSDADGGITTIHQSTVGVAQPSSIEKYFAERGMDGNIVGSSAQEFVDSSVTVGRESRQVLDLLNRFSSNEALTSGARTALSELLIQHKAALLAALGKEERQLVALQLIAHPVLSADGMQGNEDALKVASQRNFTLCEELTSGSTDSPRPAQTIAPELATSIAQLRAVVLHISAAAQIDPPPSANATTANQNR